MPGLGHGPHFASISGDLRALSADAPFQARTGSSAAASALSSKAACAGLVTARVSPVSSSMSLPGRSTQRMQGVPLNGAHQEKLSGRSNGATGNAAQFVRCVGFCRLRLACYGAFPARTAAANAAYKAVQANPNEARTIGRGQGSRSTRRRQCARASSSSMSAFAAGRLNRLQPGAPIRPRGSSCPAATSVLRTQLGLRQ